MQAVPAGETSFPLPEYVDDQDRRAPIGRPSGGRCREPSQAGTTVSSRDNFAPLGGG
jgi:hypothetical protein